MTMKKECTTWQHATWHLACTCKQGPHIAKDLGEQVDEGVLVFLQVEP